MLVCGVDEAGRGPLAGPVVAAAAVFDENFTHPEIQDSKAIIRLHNPNSL
jgi:ribonuclease HII